MTTKREKAYEHDASIPQCRWHQPPRCHAETHEIAERLRISDETHLASDIKYETMHTGCILVLHGRNLRLNDGSLDREKILAGVERLVRRVPEFRLRVVDSPLGMTAPAWVPADDFDLRAHVHFTEGTHGLRSTPLRWFIDGDRGLLPRDRPLWDFTFTSLSDAV